MARSFNGSSDVASYGTIAGLNGASAASISAWLYRSSTGTTCGLGGVAGSSAGGGTNRFSCIWFTDARLYFSAGQSGTGGYAYASLSGTGWRHVTLVFDGSESGTARAKLYIDGTAASVTYLSTPGTALGNVSPFVLGKDASDRFCGGAVAEVGLWVGTALAAGQCAALGVGVVPPAVLLPTLYSPLAGRASPEPDLVGGYSGTLTGTSQAEHPRVYRRRGTRTIFVGAGGGGVTGTAAITDADDAVSAAGAVRVSGTASLADADDGISAAGAVALTGAATLADDADTMTSAGTVLMSGAAAITDADDAASAAGTILVSGSASLTDADDTASAIGTVLVTGSAALTDADDTVSATSGSGVFGTAALADADDGTSAAGIVLVSATATVADDTDAASAAGTVRVAGAASLADADDATTTVGTVLIRGSAALIDADDLVAGGNAPAGDTTLYVFNLF